MTEWQEMDTAPRDQTIIEGQLPDGRVRRMIWAWGGGWSGEFNLQNPLCLRWLSFNEASQPVAWRDCGGGNAND